MKAPILYLILGLVLGLLLGFLAAGCFYNEQAKKAAEERKRLHRHTQKPQLPTRPAGSDSRLVSEAIESESASRKPVDNMQPPVPVPPASVSQPPEENTKDWSEHLYQTFHTAGTLSLQFRYSFPSTSLFQPGEGYLRSKSNHLLPDRSLFSGLNTIAGYAMNGTLWAFNMVLQGREFTFSQIMDGQAGYGYVQPHAVLEPAIIAETSSPGYYQLVQAGKLEMREVH